MPHMLNTYSSRLIIFFLIVGIQLSQFLFRSLDDNRLVSWGDAFISVRPFDILLIMSLCLVALLIAARPQVLKRYPKFFLFVVSYGVAAVFWREPELILDASRYYTQAKHLEVFGPRYFLSEWGRSIPAWTDMPLMPMLYGLIFRIAGESRIYIQICTTLFFALTVLLTYLIGRSLWDEWLGLSAGILLLGIPYLYTQVPLMLTDVPLMFFLALSVYTFIRSLEQGGLMCLFASLSIVLTFFTKYSAPLMLTVLIPVFGVYATANPDRKSLLVRRGSLTLLISLLLISVLVMLKSDVIAEQMRFLMAYQKPGLGRWGESFLSTFFFQVHPLITLSALYSGYEALRKKDLRHLIISWLLILVVIFQIRRIRYIIAVFPMLCLMASYGLMRFRSEGRTIILSLSVAISSIVLAICVYLPYTEKISLVNLKTAGEFLDTLPGDEIEVFTVQQESLVANTAVAVPLLDLFTRKLIRYTYILDTHPPREEIETSPLRFTWAYKNPSYYEQNTGMNGRTAVVVITGSPNEELPENIRNVVRGYAHSRVFRTAENVFDYKTYLTIYYD